MWHPWQEFFPFVQSYVFTPCRVEEKKWAPILNVNTHWQKSSCCGHLIKISKNHLSYETIIERCKNWPASNLKKNYFVLLLKFQNAFDWGQVDKNALAKCLLTLCRQLQDILSEEPRLLKLKSPMYILGRCLGHL